VVCRGGSVVAGGGATPTSGSGASLAAVAETSFPARCPALPGLQYVDIYPASSGGWSAVVYQER
jgi:hypothetical protein